MLLDLPFIHVGGAQLPLAHAYVLLDISFDYTERDRPRDKAGVRIPYLPVPGVYLLCGSGQWQSFGFWAGYMTPTHVHRFSRCLVGTDCMQWPQIIMTSYASSHSHEWSFRRKVLKNNYGIDRQIDYSAEVMMTFIQSFNSF